MPTHPNNGRTSSGNGNRRWRPEEEPPNRHRGDDRFWEDRTERGLVDDREDRDLMRPRARFVEPDRSYHPHDQGYPGTFEERSRELEHDHDHPHEETYAGPRGYGYSDGDRPLVRGHRLGMLGGSQLRAYQGERPHGHRGKGPMNFQRSDERIREVVCEILTDDDRIDASNVEVMVKGGEVTLSGMVEDRIQKRLAEDVIEAVGGVTDIQNQLRISGDRRRRM
jgi:hypothetical protein